MNYNISKISSVSRYFFIGMCSMLVSCVEEIDFVTENFESALVIEATITNELKQQEIKLSRTYRFEEEGANVESEATVSIDTGNGTYFFNEEEPGRYLSTSAFAAQTGVDYRLQIETSAGRNYSSNVTQLTQITQLDDLYSVRETNDDDVNGMSIYVDTYDPTGSSNYYRFEYEETYKIIAPKWDEMDLAIINADLCQFGLLPKTQEERICYKTQQSVRLNLATTTGLSEDRLTRHLIRFIASDDYILSHRYSILLRQYVASREAYIYYETLSQFNDDGSLFSAVQPGFFNGNVFSESNAQEKVIGFFDVSSVIEERIYFNYEDFYPDEDLPPYVVACNPFAPEFRCDIFLSELQRNRIKFESLNENPVQMEGPYNIVLRPCGDCTALGENIKPDFWQE